MRDDRDALIDHALHVLRWSANHTALVLGIDRKTVLAARSRVRRAADRAAKSRRSTAELAERFAEN